jgi:hypothetical protein
VAETPKISKQSAHEGANCQPYTPAAFTQKRISLVLIYIRGLADPGARVGPEGLGRGIIPNTSSEIKPASFPTCTAMPQPNTLPLIPAL